MSHYCVTFRIADQTVKGKTYDDRRQGLIEALRGAGYWEETTSFILAESDLDTPSFTARASKALSRADDLLVVFDLADMSACYFGALLHADVLASFFPRLQKLP